MATQVQLRRGTATENNSFTGAQGELTFDTTNKRVRVHDGSAAGGFELVTEDGSGNITTGTVTADGLTVDHNTGGPYNVDKSLSSYSSTNGVYLNGNASGWLRLNNDGAGSTRIDLYGSSYGEANVIKMYSASNERLSIDANGDISFYEDTGTTAKFFWDASAESLGIGTSSPATPLDVTKAGGGNFVATFQNTTSATPYGVHIKDAASGANGYPLLQVTNSAGTTAHLLVHSGTGNVGIGTSSPSTNLHVSSPSNGATAIVEAQGAYNARLRILSGNANSSFLEFADPDDSDVGEIVYEHSNNSMRFNTNATEAMRIDSSGRVGIGTSSPATGGIHIAGDYASNKSDITLQNTNGGRTYRIGDGVGGHVGKLTFFDGTASAARMVIDSSGNVGIGTSSLSEKLEVSGNIFVNTSGNPSMIVKTSGAGNNPNYRLQADTNYWDLQGTFSNANDELFFMYNGSVKMGIDSSGNLLVGTTSTGAASGGSGTSGININASGAIEVARSGNPVMFVNRTTSDGDIMQFRKDGSTVGSIASDSGSMLLGSGDVGVYFDASSDRIIPMNMSTLGVRNDAIDLGGNPHRFKDLYLSGGVYLGGTGSSNPTNKLDDYEAGDFNASLTPASGSISVNASYNKLLYTKVGRLVTITGRIRIGSVSSASGAFYLTLPFTSINFAEEADFAALNLLTNGVDLDANVVSTFGEVNPNSTECYAYQQRDNNTWIALDASGLSAGDILYFAGTYTAA